MSNPLMETVIGPLRDGLLSFGTLGMLAWIVLKILAIAVPVIVSVAFYVVWERKLIGWMHVRHGPMYVGKGILQAFADVFKLLFKEVVQPTVAHPVLYRLAPMVALVPAFAAWACSRRSPTCSSCCSRKSSSPPTRTVRCTCWRR